MRINEALKAFLVKQFGLKADASEADANALIAEKFAADELTAEDVVKASNPVDPKAAVASLIDERLKAAVTPLNDAVAKMADSISKLATGQGATKTADTSAADALAAKLAETEERIAKAAADLEAKLANANTGHTDAVTPYSVLLKGRTFDQVRVKSAAEQYSTTKSAAMHFKGALAGQRVLSLDGRPMDEPSQLDKAIIGSYFKWRLNATAPFQSVPRGLKMSDHDRDLMQYAIRELPWTGMSDESDNATEFSGKLSGGQIKALLDDATSGGLEAAPIVFDDAVIQAALLYGELFPHINLVNITRGRRVEAATYSRPTIGVKAEGSAIDLFTTTDYITALDTTIFNATGSMEIGMDFEEDSPVNVGALVAQNYGEAAQAWLDKMIAIGAGSTEPIGIFVASGINSVDAANPGTGPLTVGDFEALMFGLSKAERQRGGYYAYVGHDQTYRRARAIATGSDDARRVFGMDHGSYKVLDMPYHVQNDIAESRLAYCNLKRYRMYRRAGVGLRYVSDGITLAAKNTTVVILRMRFGGQPELGSGFYKITNAPTQG